MKRISKNKIKEIVRLRLKGMSIPEISRATGSSRTTVQRYVLNVNIPIEFHKSLREKQGGSKIRAKSLRDNILEEAKKELGPFSRRDLLILLIGLYWGEGTKRDFSVINSDPYLIKTFIKCVLSTGISRDRLCVSLRVHNNVSLPEAREFWSGITGVPSGSINQVEVIEGKKKGKLLYGMCRVRVKSGIRERLFIQSAISLIGKDSLKR